MTRPKDIVPTQYEVLKLLNGTEVVGMTRDTGNGIEITLPMICKLEVVAPLAILPLQHFIHMHLYLQMQLFYFH